MRLSDRIGRRLKLHDIHVLMAIAQTGSMGKAAALLDTTQPAVSKSVADLERAVGVRLLDRSRQGVVPTAYGRALLKRSTIAFDELKQGIREIEFLSDPGAGELRIGCSPAMAEGIVTAVIEKLVRKYPRVVFRVTHAAPLALPEALRTRRIELGFGLISGVSAEDDVVYEVLIEEPLVVVAGMTNAWANRRKIELAELANEPWTWPPGAAIDASVIAAFRTCGLDPPRTRVYAEAINMRTRLAANGSFLAIVPAYIMRFAAKHPSLKVLPVELPATHRQAGIVTLKDRTLSPLAQLFIETAREVAAQSAKEITSKGRRKKLSVRDS